MARLNTMIISFFVVVLIFSGLFIILNGFFTSNEGVVVEHDVRYEKFYNTINEANSNLTALAISSEQNQSDINSGIFGTLGSSTLGTLINIGKAITNSLAIFHTFFINLGLPLWFVVGLEGILMLSVVFAIISIVTRWNF